MTPIRRAPFVRPAIAAVSALLLVIMCVGLAPDVTAQTSRFSTPPQNPGPFDGVWQGQMQTRFGFCPVSRFVDLEIRGGKIRGQVGRGRNTLSIKSNVDENGKLSAVFASSNRTLIRTRGGGFQKQAARINWQGLSEQQVERGRRPFFFDQDECSGTIVLEKVAP
ncbi:MAG: hypothetical protein QNJ92_01630 [Alphaproteobacteria bacterium]|nr:hypothetical protein [Alphaproteobacteria bacterium]